MELNANISEVFISSQGEGEYVGYRQVFIRLSGCIFDCPYCDTDESDKLSFDLCGEKIFNPITSGQLARLLVNKFGEGDRFHSYAFTGGEPLLNLGFICDCAIQLKKTSKAKLFLETSGLLPDEIRRADGIFDILSVDIKTHSYKTIKNMPFLFSVLKSLKFSEWYVKLILDDKKATGVVETVIENMLKSSIYKVVIQPVDSIISEETANNVFNAFYSAGIVARLIPQTHKMLCLR